MNGEYHRIGDLLLQAVDGAQQVGSYCQPHVGGASAWAVCAVSPRWEGPVHGLCVLSVQGGRGQCMGCVCCQSKVGGASAWAVCAVSPRWEGPVHGLCVLSVKCGRGQCMGCLCCQSKVGGASELCVLSVKCEWMQWAVSPCQSDVGGASAWAVSQMWVGPV